MSASKVAKKFMELSAIVVTLTTSDINHIIRGEGLRPLFFYAIIHTVSSVLMERDKLKLIVKNLELLVDALKSEVYSDVNRYKSESSFGFTMSDDDDDGYPD